MLDSRHSRPFSHHNIPISEGIAMAASRSFREARPTMPQ
jgi:hypothetical protein